jgi:hypothetical protein
MIEVISVMEGDLPNIIDHAHDLATFWDQQSDVLDDLKTRGRKIGRRGGKQQLERLRECRQDWQDVKGRFNAHCDEVCLRPTKWLKTLKLTYS